MHVILGVGAVEAAGVHLDVGVELLVGVRARRVAAEEHRRVDVLQLGLHADLPPHLLDQRLRALAHGIGRSLIENRKPDAVLRADAVGAAHPAGIVQQLVGARNILGFAPVVSSRGINRRRRQHAAGQPSGRPITGSNQDFPVDRHRQRAPHRRIRQKRVRIGAVLVGCPLVAQRRIGIGELHHQALDHAAKGRDDLPAARRSHGGEDFGLDLEIPGVVELAGLQHGARRRNGVPAALQQNRGEGRLVGVAIPVVYFVQDDVVRAEFLHLEGAGADRAEVLLGAFRRSRARARRELLFLDDGRYCADERHVGKRHGHLERDAHRVAVHRLNGRHVLKPAGGAAGAFGVHAIGRRERHVRGGKRTSVRPHHVVSHPPGDGQEVRREAAVFDGWNLHSQGRNHGAVLVIARQGFKHQRRRVDVLGPARQKRVQDGRRLPVEHFQLAVGASVGNGRRRQRHNSDQGQDEQSWFQPHRQLLAGETAPKNPGATIYRGKRVRCSRIGEA